MIDALPRRSFFASTAAALATLAGRRQHDRTPTPPAPAAKPEAEAAEPEWLARARRLELTLEDLDTIPRGDPVWNLMIAIMICQLGYSGMTNADELARKWGRLIGVDPDGPLPPRPRYA